MKARLLLAGALLALVGLFAWSALFERVQGDFFDSDGFRIHYTDEGSGEPVVLLHGITLDIDTQWRWPGMINALRPHYRVIAVDQRGHGSSDKPTDPGLYGRHFVDDVIRLLDHLGIERAHVVGYSLGGLVTRKLALTYPNRLISAVPTAVGWHRNADAIIAELETDALARSLERGDFGPLVAGLGSVGQPIPGPIVWLFAAALSSRNDAPAIGAVMRSTAALTVEEEELHGNRVPTLTLMGAVDPLRPATQGLEGVPAHETRIVEGYGHDLYPMWPDYEATVLAFLDAHRM